MAITSSTIVLITGANSGLGFETVKALLRSERRYHILLTGRNLSKAEAAAHLAAKEVSSSTSTIEAIQLDVEDDASITRAFETVSKKHDRIDCLINNAGINVDHVVSSNTLTQREAQNKSWDVNVTGAHITTQTFLPLLLHSSDPRLIFLTSGLASLADAADLSRSQGPRPLPAGLEKGAGAMAATYRPAKAGLNMLMLEWCRFLANDGVKVWSVAPGLLATGLTGNPERLRQAGAKDPSVGGEVLRNVVEGKRDGETGLVVREYETPIQRW